MPQQHELRLGHAARGGLMPATLGCSCRKRYVMYPHDASDTDCVGDAKYTPRIITSMDTWQARAKMRMKQDGVTQEDLVPVFGVTTRGAVGHYLSGRRIPSPTQMKALADHLRMSLDELMGGPSDESAQKTIRQLNLEVWEKIKEARTRAGLTQAQVADACGISREAVSQWEARDEAKRTHPGLENLLQFARLTGSSIGWLTGELNEGSQEPLENHTSTPGTAPTLTPDEQAILDLWRALDSDGRRAVQAVGHALAKPMKGRGKVQDR